MSITRGFLGLLALVVACACNDSPVASTAVPPPRSQGDTLSEAQACFTLEPDSDQIEEGEPLVLDARCSTGTSPDATFQWDLGDGRTRSGPRISVRYAQSGAYTIELRVNDRGAVSTVRKELQVVPRLSACFTFERVPFVGDDALPCTFAFDASCSAGPIREYRWFFEGSRIVPDDDTTATTSSPQIEHTWSSNTECFAFRPFERLVRLTVVAPDGRTTEVEHTVAVTRPLK
jgi:hypothetical protein